VKPRINSIKSNKLILGDVKNSHPLYSSPRLTTTQSFSSLISLENVRPCMFFGGKFDFVDICLDVVNIYFNLPILDAMQLCSPSSSDLSSGIKFNANAAEFFPSKVPTASSSLNSLSSQPAATKPLQRMELCFTRVESKSSAKQRIQRSKEVSLQPLANIIGLNPIKSASRKGWLNLAFL
jgi:hypothetical protein